MSRFVNKHTSKEIEFLILNLLQTRGFDAKLEDKIDTITLSLDDCTNLVISFEEEGK